MEVVASLSQGRTAAAQCGLFKHKSVPVIFEPPCITNNECSGYRNEENIIKVLLSTDEQKCFKRSIKIYIKNAPTRFGIITIIRERTIWAC